MLKPLKIRTDQYGQTLVEVIIAIAVLALAMGSAGSLAATSTRVTTESGRRTQATALAAREAEALRSHRDGLAEMAGPPRTLHQYFTSGPATGTGGCRSFVMREDSSSGTGWRTEAVTGSVAYSAADNIDIERADNYRRVVTACQGDDYDAIDGQYSLSEHLYDIEVRVLWTEAGGPERELKYRTMLATPRGAHLE